ncbi:MAG TPA: hypothetical protein VGG88_05520, partial [Gaiellaceae bacterium]
ADMARESKVLAIRGGVLEGRIVSAEEVESLATLPPVDVLRGQVLAAIVAPLTSLLGLVTAPVQNLYGLIDARIEQLGGEGAAEAAPEPGAEAEGGESAADEAFEPASEAEAAATEESTPATATAVASEEESVSEEEN